MKSREYKFEIIMSVSFNLAKLIDWHTHLFIFYDVGTYYCSLLHFELKFYSL